MSLSFTQTKMMRTEEGAKLVIEKLSRAALLADDGGPPVRFSGNHRQLTRHPEVGLCEIEFRDNAPPCRWPS